MNKSINHIQWNKNGTRIIQYQNSKVRDKKKESYELFLNGTLKIKRLDRSDEGTYKVIMYDEDGKNVLEKTFVLRILGKSLFPNSCFQYGYYLASWEIAFMACLRP